MALSAHTESYDDYDEEGVEMILAASCSCCGWNDDTSFNSLSTDSLVAAKNRMHISHKKSHPKCRHGIVFVEQAPEEFDPYACVELVGSCACGWFDTWTGFTDQADEGYNQMLENHRQSGCSGYPVIEE